MTTNIISKIPFCNQPWTNLFLHNTGRIQPCCMNSTQLGSVYVDDLEDVWNCGRLQEIRRFILQHDYAGAGCKPECPVAFQISKESSYNGNNPKWGHSASTDPNFKNNFDLFLESIKKRQLKALNYPMDIDIQSTESCNLSCIMCHQNHGKKGHLPSATISRFLSRLESIHTVRFQGGEIFIDPKFSGFLCNLKDKFKPFQEIHIITNGTLIDTPEILQMTSAPNPIHFIVSIDAVNSTVYKYIRRSPHFNKAWDTLKLLASRQKDIGRTDIVQWNFVVMKSNFHQLETAIKIAFDLDVTLHFQPIIGPYPDENIFEYPQIRPSGALETIRNCIELASRLKSKPSNLLTIKKKLSLKRTGKEFAPAI